MNPQQPRPSHSHPQQSYPYPPNGVWPPNAGAPTSGGYPQAQFPPPGLARTPVAAQKKRKWPWVVLAAVALLVIIVATSGKGNGPATSAGGTAPSANAASEPDAPAASAPTTYTGKGDDVVTIKKDSGPAIVSFECAKCSGNTVLQSDGGDSLLVNTIGTYSGRRLVDGMDGSVTSTLTVKATGAWKITVASGLASAKRAETNVSGRGDDVVVLTGKISKAAITNKGGSSNFVVQVYGESGFPDLAVNTIGGYAGTVPVQGPAALAITSTGNWTIVGS